MTGITVLVPGKVVKGTFTSLGGVIVSTSMMMIRRETALLLAGDLIFLASSLWLALFARALHPPAPAYYYEHLKAFSLVFLVSILTFFIAGLYEKKGRLVKSAIGFRVLGAQTANTVIAALLFFFLPAGVTPKIVLVLYLAVSVVVLSSWRFFAVPHLFVSSRDRRVLVGTGDAVKELYETVRGHKKYFFSLVELIDTAHADEAEILHEIDRLVSAGVTSVVLDTKEEKIARMLPSLYADLPRDVSLIEFALLYEEVFDRVSLDHIDHTWILEYLPKPRLGYDIGKCVFDRAGAAAGLLVALVFLVPAVLALLLTGAKPFIFHERIGRNGHPFRIIKLRTMLLDDHGDPELQKKNRVTRVGRFLRKARIDELPQLINVLMGHLSFIGPRPELPSIAEVYEREIPYYGARHLVMPGLSGWAQIYDYDAPRGGADVARTRKKLSFDLYYLKHRSLSLDMAVALKTLRALLSFSGT